MTDLIQRITEAIFRQEGMTSDFANPGNLRRAPWLIDPTYVDGFWRPISRAQGVAGAAHCVALRVAEGQTLRQLITAWAPASDGNATNTYLANVQNWAAIPNADQVLYELL